MLFGQEGTMTKLCFNNTFLRCTDPIFFTNSDDPVDEEALQHVCTGSGGQFLESSKTDVQDIVALLSQSIQTSQVKFINIKFHQQLEIISYNSRPLCHLPPIHPHKNQPSYLLTTLSSIQITR